MRQFYTCEDQRPWETICTAWSVSNISLCWSSEIGAWKGMAMSKYWQFLRCSTGYYEQWIQATHQYLFSSGRLDQSFLWERWADWEGGRVIGLVKGAHENRGKGRTTLVIAHRLSTITTAHQILVLRIAEKGTHEELLVKDGIYAMMWRTQERWPAVEEQRLRRHHKISNIDSVQHRARLLLFLTMYCDGVEA